MIKPRLLVIDTQNTAGYDLSTEPSEISSPRRELLEKLSEIQDQGIDVYFAQKDYPGISDAENGLRFLRWNPDDLPSFGNLDFVVMIGSESLRELVQSCYPDSTALFLPPPGSENWAPGLSLKSIVPPMLQAAA